MRHFNLQAMAPTNVKTVHQTSLLHNIESNLDRLGLLPPTHGQRSQQQSGHIMFHSVLMNRTKFLKATRHHAEIRKIEIPRSMVVEAFSAGVQYLKKNQNAPRRPSEHPPVRGKKMSKHLGGIIGCKYKTSISSMKCFLWDVFGHPRL